MNARRLCALLTLPVAVTVAACTSSAKGPSGNSTAPSGATTDAAALSARVRTAVADIKTAHINLEINLAGQPLSGPGDEKLAAGKLVALDLTENLPGGAGAIRIIVVDGKTYAKLPPSMNAAGKPYLLVTPSSSNSVIRQLASSLDSALSAASLGAVSAFVGAAKSIEAKGTESVAGVSATHYSMQVEIAKLPGDLPGKSELASSGPSTIPLELYLDAQGRPVEVSRNFEVQGQSVPTKATFTAYDKPVTITAPPADQIGS